MNITMEYIARKAGVSKATVSRVLNNTTGVSNETRIRIKEIMDEYGYQPYQFIKRERSNTKTIGLVIPDITNPFFPAIVKAVENFVSKHGYTVILCNTDSSQEKEQACISTLIANNVDGVILTTTLDEQNRAQYNLKKYGVPCILLDRRAINTDFSGGIFVDNEYAFYQATELLIRHGNDKIAFIMGPKRLSTSVERLAGYTRAIEQFGLKIDPNLILHGDFSYEGGRQAVFQLIEQEIPFNAVLASNDIMAIGALKTLRDMKINVPETVEVIGFDNIQFSGLVDPPLTTFEQPIYDMGTKAAQALLTLIRKKPLNETSIRVEAKLVIRQTTRSYETTR